MVRKLMKHELRALFRILLYLGIVVILLSCVGRLLTAIDPNGYLGIVFSVMSIWFAVLVCAAAFIASITQFSRSLFTGEGYMTFSLPVTPMQLIWSKLLSAIIASIFGILVAVISCLILMIGLDAEVVQIITDLFSDLFNMLHAFFSYDPMLGVEFILTVIISIPMSLLLFYSIVCIGQLFTKSRKAITFGIAIAVIIIALPILDTYCFTPIMNAAEEVSLHLANWIQIVVYAAVDVGCFFLIRYILTHRVNLIV